MVYKRRKSSSTTTTSRLLELRGREYSSTTLKVLALMPRRLSGEEKCRDVVVWFNNQYPGLLDKQATYYDLQRILYSVRKLEFVTREVTYNVAMPPEFNHGIVNCMLTFKTVTETSNLTLEIFQRPAQIWTTLISLRVTTSLFHFDKLPVEPADHGFREEDLPNSLTMFLFGGWSSESCCHRNKEDSFSSGAVCLRQSSLCSQGFGSAVLNGDLIKLKIFLKGCVLTLEQYFLHRYGIALTLPNAPYLNAKSEAAKNFPMEVCTVADNQRVKNLQQTPRQVQEMIRRCAVVPFQNEYLREASVKFIPNNLKVKARVLSSPTIEYLGESAALVPTL
uniref:PAZ domain-containing protein n=1 Tax=Ditylenchus dipsaci TaxID=166011 RepID=A0A915EKU9_9BILA